MIVFQVEVNGKLVAYAGKDDLSVLTASVGALGVLGNESNGTVAEKEGFELDLNISGLSVKDDNEPGDHVRWTADQKIEIGDEINIRVLKSSNADKPLEKIKTSQQEYENQKLKHWESARDYYLKFKGKYESKNG